MRLTREQVNNLEDGTELVVFLSGSDWDEDFGKVIKVMKFKDRLMKYDKFCDINDVDSGDTLDIQAAIKYD